jgi:hypothetical protein
MAKILKTDSGKIIEINPDRDLYLYKAPVNPPNTGTQFTRGADLYAHKTRNGNWYYYLLTWSMWQGDSGGPELISRDEAISFLQDKATLTGWAELDEREIEKAVEHFGQNIFAETA